jgi:hypothetical protein
MIPMNIFMHVRSFDITKFILDKFSTDDRPSFKWSLDIMRRPLVYSQNYLSIYSTKRRNSCNLLNGSLPNQYMNAYFNCYICLRKASGLVMDGVPAGYALYLIANTRSNFICSKVYVVIHTPQVEMSRRSFTYS